MLLRIAVALIIFLGVGVAFYATLEYKECETAEAIAAWDAAQHDREAAAAAAAQQQTTGSNRTLSDDWSWRYLLEGEKHSFDVCLERCAIRRTGATAQFSEHAASRYSRWTVVDALFFSVVTMTTVGYGDLAPTSNGSRFFTCFYMLFGVVFIFTQTQGVVKLLLEKTESRVVAALERRAERARAALERAGFYRFGSSRDGRGGSRDGSRARRPATRVTAEDPWRNAPGGAGDEAVARGRDGGEPTGAQHDARDSAESLRDSAATAHSKASTLDKDSRLEPSRKPPEQIAVDAAHMDMSHPAFHMEAAFPFYLKNSIFWLLLGFAVLLIGAATFAYVEEIDEVDSGGGLRHWSDLPWPDGPTSYGAVCARAFYFCWSHDDGRVRRCHAALAGGSGLGVPLPLRLRRADRRRRRQAVDAEGGPDAQAPDARDAPHAGA